MSTPALRLATQILQRGDAGGAAALDALLPLAHGEVLSLASARLRAERPGHAIQPAVLVHEAYGRLVDQDRVPWSDAIHFRRVAARAVRQVLVGLARHAAQRGDDGIRLALDEGVRAAPGGDVDILALDEAITELGVDDARKAMGVELIIYGGMTPGEAASVLGVAGATADADWSFSRAWLAKKLGWDESSI